MSQAPDSDLWIGGNDGRKGLLGAGDGPGGTPGWECLRTAVHRGCFVYAASTEGKRKTAMMTRRHALYSLSGAGCPTGSRRWEGASQATGNAINDKPWGNGTPEDL